MRFRFYFFICFIFSVVRADEFWLDFGTPNLYNPIEEKEESNFLDSNNFLFLKDVELTSITTYSHLNTFMFPKNFNTGYSALFAKSLLETKKVHGFYGGIGFSVLARIGNFNKNSSFYADKDANVTDEIYSYLINNDEAKDVLSTSNFFHFPSAFLGYEKEINNNIKGGFLIGRYAQKYEWIGDFLEGGEVNLYINKWRLALGGFYRQSYSNPQENARFGYIQDLYRLKQNLHIKTNFYFDTHYKSEFSGARIYANYFDGLFLASGVKFYRRKNIELDSGYILDLGMLVHATFISASKSSPALCSNPNAESSGLSCFMGKNIGELNGGVWHIEGKIGSDTTDIRKGEWNIFLGYVGNSSEGASNRLPIYADNNPLEYNTYIYGDAAQTGYFRFDYRTKNIGGFIGYGKTFYFIPQLVESNQIVGELEFSIKKLAFHLTSVYMDAYQSKSIISKLVIDYNF